MSTFSANMYVAACGDFFFDPRSVVLQWRFLGKIYEVPYTWKQRAYKAASLRRDPINQIHNMYEILDLWMYRAAVAGT